MDHHDSTKRGPLVNLYFSLFICFRCELPRCRAPWSSFHREKPKNNLVGFASKMKITRKEAFEYLELNVCVQPCKLIWTLCLNF